jgi:hypothetical protein
MPLALCADFRVSLIASGYAFQRNSREREASRMTSNAGSCPSFFSGMTEGIGAGISCFPLASVVLALAPEDIPRARQI